MNSEINARKIGCERETSMRRTPSFQKPEFSRTKVYLLVFLYRVGLLF